MASIGSIGSIDERAKTEYAIAQLCGLLFHSLDRKLPSKPPSP
jgi:hypothetical protein